MLTVESAIPCGVFYERVVFVVRLHVSYLWKNELNIGEQNTYVFN